MKFPMQQQIVVFGFFTVFILLLYRGRGGPTIYVALNNNATNNRRPKILEKLERLTI